MAAQNLRTPGPTPLPPAVREALSQDMVNHRGPEFAAILRECVDGLKWAFQVREHDVVKIGPGPHSTIGPTASAPAPATPAPSPQH